MFRVVLWQGSAIEVIVGREAFPSCLKSTTKELRDEEDLLESKGKCNLSQC